MNMIGRLAINAINDNVATRRTQSATPIGPPGESSSDSKMSETQKKKTETHLATDNAINSSFNAIVIASRFDGWRPPTPNVGK